MESINIQIQNILFQIKNMEIQFQNIITQIQNIGMQSISLQLQNFGIQFLNMGIQVINIGIGIPYMGEQMPNTSQQIYNIGIQIQNLGITLDKKNQMNMQMLNDIQMNQNMMNMMMNNNINQNIKENNLNNFDDDLIDLKFEIDPDNIIIIHISNQKTIEEAINMFKIKIKSNKKDKFKFIFNGKELYPKLKINESGLNHLSRILVISNNDLIGGSNTIL